jgi:RNA polymerase sigma factor (sigma-70 family)
VAIRPNTAIFRQIQTLFDVGVIGDLTDTQLLERFTTLDHEAAELAFAALVERHGPMVLRVCRNLLNNPHDAQDAFQATFLVLVQKARSLWVKDSLAPWLHRVAHRVASRARASTVRRRDHERRAAEQKPTLVYYEDKTEGLLGPLHKEIDRLPERYRVAVILCDLQGLSHERASRQLGWPVGTVKSRLARARQLLRSRLTGRGFGSPAILVITKAATNSVDSAVSLRMVESTLQIARLVTKAPTIGVISVRAANLAEEVLKAMFLSKLKLILAPVMLACALAIGTASVRGRQDYGFDPGPAADRPRAKRSDLARPAPEGGATEAPAFIKQSRGMIISRLEQELALAKNRLDRTLRRVVSPNDPAAVQGRKTVDEIEGLLDRIDGVLVDAVDRFPTMFDFSGGQVDLGSASASPTSGKPKRVNTVVVNSVDRFEFIPFSGGASKDGRKGQGTDPFSSPGPSMGQGSNFPHQAGAQNAKPSTGTNKNEQSGQGNNPSSTKPGNPQKNDQAAGEKGSQSSEMNKTGQKGHGTDPSSGKPGDPQKNDQAAGEKGNQSSGTDKGAQKGQGNDPSSGKPGNPQKNDQAAGEKGSQSSGTDKGAQKGQGNDPSSGKPGDPQKNDQATGKNESQSSEKTGQKGQGNDPSSNQNPGDAQSKNNPNANTASKTEAQDDATNPPAYKQDNPTDHTHRDPRNQVPSNDRRMPSQDPRAPNSSQPRDQKPTQEQSDQHQNRMNSNPRGPKQNQQQNPDQREQQTSNQNRSKAQQPDLHMKGPPAANQPGQQQPSQNKQQHQPPQPSDEQSPNKKQPQNPDAIGESGLEAREREAIDVTGIADVDLVVSERKRVLDIGGQTTFQIRLRNYGTKDATHLIVTAKLSPNLEFVKADGPSQDVYVNYSPQENAVMFQRIDKLGPSKEIVLGVVAKVTGRDPKLATCRASVIHDDLPDGNAFEDMAGVRVTSPRRAQ